MSRLAKLRQLDVSTPEATKQSLARLVQELDEMFDELARQNRFLVGKGSPEGVVRAPVGTGYWRLDGGTTTTLYVKEDGGGPSGWVAK